MRINEFAVLKESISGKDIFVQRFVNEITDYINSVGKTGQPIKIMDYVRAYFQRYGMQLSSQQREMLRQACTEVDNEYNYFITQQKTQAKQAQKPGQPAQQGQNPGQQAFGSMASQLSGTPQNTSNNPAGNQAFDKMAAQLYKSGPATSIQAQSQAAAAPAKKQSPASYYGLDDRIEPTMEGVMGDLWNSVKSKASTLAGSFLAKIGLGSVNKLANVVYSVLMTQPTMAQQGQGRNVGMGGGMGGGMNGGFGGRGRGQMNATPKPKKDVAVTPQVQQIVKSIKAMKGPEFQADLTQIIKTALWNLYGGDKTAYNEAINKLFGKAPAVAPQQQAEPEQETPNLGGKNAFNQMASQLKTYPGKVKPRPNYDAPHPGDDNPNLNLGSNE